MKIFSYRNYGVVLLLIKVFVKSGEKNIKGMFDISTFTPQDFIFVSLS